jgi:hypothetical protein
MNIKNTIPLAHAMNFEADIREHILTKLPHRPNDAVALHAMATHELLIIYLNWRERFIPQRPRKVNISNELRQNSKVVDDALALVFDAICKKIEAGDDLNPHLSDDVLIGFQSTPAKPKKRFRRKDLDLMLNDWGVHHLHMSTTIRSNGFTRRVGTLLFAVFKDDDAYLIQIVNHRDWTQKSIIEIVIREWPDAGIVFEQKGADLTGMNFSEAEHKKLRNAGINIRHEYGEKTWLSRGITTAGTSISATDRARKILNSAQCFERKIEEESHWFPSTLSASGLVQPSSFSFKFIFLPEGCVIFEENSTAIYPLGT